MNGKNCHIVRLSNLFIIRLSDASESELISDKRIPQTVRGELVEVSANAWESCES